MLYIFGHREVAMLKFIRSWFAPDQHKSREQVRKEVMERHEEIGRSIAERYARGNVNIKAGRFLTEQDIAARKAHIKAQ